MDISSKVIEDVSSEVCSKLCKWNELEKSATCTEEKQMIKRFHCDRCPLNRLNEG